MSSSPSLSVPVFPSAPSPACSSAPTSPLSSAALEALHQAADSKLLLLRAEDTYRRALAQLDALVSSGELPTVDLPPIHGMTIYRSDGRLSWTYPASIRQLEQQLKQQKKLCEQLGEASCRQGAPFWTIKDNDKVFP
jgi:hypothetical protein